MIILSAITLSNHSFYFEPEIGDVNAHSMGIKWAMPGRHVRIQKVWHEMHGKLMPDVFNY